MKHTATPWRIGMKPGPMIYGPQDEWIADLRIETNIPNENGHNAAFVVRACNAHEELLTACRKTLDIWHRMPGCPDPECQVCRENKRVESLLTAAIRKAEEE